jgi:murein DD-endopeptidase MepM/ murein hydrolase activator NlpD
MLLLASLALLLAPAAAGAQSGGAMAPDGGGTSAEQPIAESKPTTVKRPARGRAQPVASRFAVFPRTIRPGTGPIRFTYRIDGRATIVRVRIELVPDGKRRAAARLQLGDQRTGRVLVYDWAPRASALPSGRYTVRLHAVDRAGRVLRRAAASSGRQRVEVLSPPPPPSGGPGVFPLRGTWSFGGADARFGASRSGHSHQGQDLVAAEGTPVVSPQAGYVFWRAYQANGAGHYLVVRADDGRDYVFMHLRDGSLLVAKDLRVTAGQPLAQVGNTGRSDGAHLHFEIWPDGWYASSASKPIDPLPDLLAWAGMTAPPAG